jgi:type IV pilus assembly protein PilM
MADESIWKKEISFGRKRKEQSDDAPAADAAAEESTSLWKKELSFGRKKKEEADAPEPVAEEPEPAAVEPVAADARPEEQTWTRAVSFGRKAPAEEPAPLEVAAEAEEPVPDTETGAQEPAQEEATWTRAVSFGRQADPEPVPEELPVVEAQEEPAQEEAVWTRAVSFGRQADPEPVPEEPTVVEPASAEIAAEGDELAVVTETGPEEPIEEEATWTRAVSFGRQAEEAVPVSAVPDEPASVGAEEERQEAIAVPPVSFSPDTEAPVAPAAEPPQTWSAQPEGPPAPAPGVHAPVTADELSPLDEAEAEEKKVPFWKKEIGGKKKQKPATKVAAAPIAAATAANVPFWKKELGGKKKQKPDKPAPEPVAVEEPTEVLEPAAKVPFWKKDFGGKAKAPKQPKQKKEPKAKAARGARGAKRITGLKVGASQIAVARVANNGSAELLQIARSPLEPGIVVGGELRDPDALAEALKEFFSEHGIPKKGVRLGIANNRIGVRTFEIAGVEDEKQLSNAIRFRAQETLPIPIDEAVLDYQVLGEGTDDQGQPTKRVLLVVAYRELIDRYLDACKKAGISLVGIDLEAFALLRALQAPQEGTGGDAAAALVAVAIGHDRSTFAVSDGRICEFTRVLEWGGSALNVAIARALDAAPSEVDGVKRALALTDEMVPEGLTPEQAQKARDAMRRAIQTFARELVSSLQYYQNQPGSLGIGEIVLTGGTAHLSGLASELERLIGVRVRVGDPLARMKVSKKVGEAEQVGSLAVAIGLGIED